MAQSISGHKIEDKLQQTSGLAVGNYNKNVPILHSKKDMAETKVIRSDFSPENKKAIDATKYRQQPQPAAIQSQNIPLAAQSKKQNVKIPSQSGINSKQSSYQALIISPQAQSPVNFQNIALAGQNQVQMQGGPFRDPSPIHNKNPNQMQNPPNQIPFQNQNFPSQNQIPLQNQPPPPPPPPHNLAPPVNPYQGPTIGSNRNINSVSPNPIMAEPKGYPPFPNAFRDQNQHEGKHPLPGDYKFYSTVKQALPQDYPMTGFEKLMMGNSLTMRPIFHVDKNEGTWSKNISTFYIYPGLHSREQYCMEPMFVVREQTNRFARLCLTTDCRPFQVLVSHDYEGENVFLNLTRECSFNCLCMGRPEMFIDYIEEGTNQKFDMGGISHPFVCGGYELEAFSSQGETLFVITAQRCACNIYCCFGCEVCNKSEFTIHDLFGKELGNIEIGTHYQSCTPGTSECDHFTLSFYPHLRVRERILLFSAMIFISTRLFSRGCGFQTELD